MINKEISYVKEKKSHGDELYVVKGKESNVAETNSIISRKKLI